VHRAELASFILGGSTSCGLKGLSRPVLDNFKNTDINIDIYLYKIELAIIILIICILMACR